MKRPNVKTAMVGIFATFAILFAVLGYVTVSGMQSLHETSERIVHGVQPGISMAKDIQVARYSLRGSYSDYAMGRTSGDPAALEKKIASRQDKLMETIKAYEPYADAEAEQSAFKNIEESATKYIAAGQNMLALARDGKRDEAMQAFDKDLGPIADILAENVDVVVKFNQELSDEGIAESEANFRSRLLTIYAILAVSAVLVTVAIWFGVTGIAAPVSRIAAAMRKLAAGDTTLEVAGKDRGDEIGEMANAVEVFRKAAIANRELQADADASRQKVEAERIRLTGEAEAAAQARLSQATAGLASGLRRLASGDLAFQLNEAFAPDFEALRHDLNDAVSELGQTLSAVAQSANQIDGGTREIGQGAQDLSHRTEQQAASLEETAAALDQITANVANSSKRADEARQVAIEANASAAQSGRVVASAIDAMGKIEQSSSQISSIIGVIDEIAFQTNLLALNAGVEAARAGEAGKGFAVVAQEVRELAQRSAQAAKQIKELIGNSSVEVEGGVKLVRETGTALKTIEQLVATINQHMDAIATSSREQSTGLSEVNSAVNQMDQVTQQNAAMVEETNAASATLLQEASRLKQLIGRFQLGNTGHAHAADQVSALCQTASAMAHRTPAKTLPAARGNTALKQEWAEF